MSAACASCRTCARPRNRCRATAPARAAGCGSTSSTGVANDIIIPALPDFFKRYPDIALELGCGDRPVDLIEEGVDCAIRGGALPDSSLIARRIGVLHFVTCASPAYLAEHGRPTHPNDLRKHRCVNYFSSKTGKIYDWDFSRGDEQIQIAAAGLPGGERFDRLHQRRPGRAWA